MLELTRIVSEFGYFDKSIVHETKVLPERKIFNFNELKRSEIYEIKALIIFLFENNLIEYINTFCQNHFKFVYYDEHLEQDYQNLDIDSSIVLCFVSFRMETFIKNNSFIEEDNMILDLVEKLKLFNYIKNHKNNIYFRYINKIDRFESDFIKRIKNKKNYSK